MFPGLPGPSDVPGARGEMAKTYTVWDGKPVLVLHPAEEGGYMVTSPLDPELVTEAETVEEAFEMARDALKHLRLARTDLARRPLSKAVSKRKRSALR
jgi:antitoxin HicB